MGILICGLNGAGKSTLGKALASRMGYEFIDNEDLFFPKEDAAYEYSNPRSKEEAIQILEKRINNNSRFVFAAVRGDYGDKLISVLDHIIIQENFTMEKTIYDESNGLWYELQGDYYIPCLTVPVQDERPIGIWGQRHLRYIKT